MRRLLLGLALIASLVFLTLPTSSQGLLVVQRKAVTSSTPPLPDFSNIAAVWGLFNFNPVGYPEGFLADCADSENSLAADAVAPYSGLWANFINDATAPPPYLTNHWFDQNSNANDLIQSGSARPVLQITSSVLVSGAGTAAANGTYGFTALDGNGHPYYNLTGTNAVVSAISYDAGADYWRLYSSGGAALYFSAGNVTPFPWQDEPWDVQTGIAPAPAVSAVSPQKGEVQFDGSTSALQSSGNLTLSKTFTAYIWFKLPTAAPTGVLFETSANGITTAGAVSVRLVASVLTCSVVDSTGLLLNTKIVTVSDTNYHLLTFRVDTQAAAASQVQIWLDGSQTGVTAPIATDLASETLSNTKLSVGARNNGASAFLPCAIQELPLFFVAHDTSTRTNWQNYLTYLGGL